MYLENALKTNNLETSIKLANCFVNVHTMKSVYSPELQKEIDKNCPIHLKNNLRIPDFYMLLVDKLRNSENIINDIL